MHSSPFIIGNRAINEYFVHTLGFVAFGAILQYHQLNYNIRMIKFIPIAHPSMAGLIQVGREITPHIHRPILPQFRKQIARPGINQYGILVSVGFEGCKHLRFACGRRLSGPIVYTYGAPQFRQKPGGRRCRFRIGHIRPIVSRRETVIFHDLSRSNRGTTQCDALFEFLVVIRPMIIFAGTALLPEGRQKRADLFPSRWSADQYERHPIPSAVTGIGVNGRGPQNFVPNRFRQTQKSAVSLKSESR